MTQKQKQKIANNLVKYELIHRNLESSKEEVEKAEKEIIKISNMLFALPDGMTLMMEIDHLVHQKLSKIN